MQKRGVLIALEGIDGAGLTTQSRLLVEKLKKFLGGRVVYTKEPTHSLMGSIVLTLINKGLSEDYLDAHILSLLFAADRYYHIYRHRFSTPLGELKGIRSLLIHGFIVVTDRYKYSSYVYQSTVFVEHADEESMMKWIEILNSFAPPPHILVFLDVPPELAIDRIVKDKNRSSRTVYEDVEILRKLRNKFISLLEKLRLHGEEVSKFIPSDLRELYKGLRVPRVIVVSEVDEKGLQKGLEELSNEIFEKVVKELKYLNVI